VRITDKASYENPNVVKVVCDAEGNALYFSRATIRFFKGNKIARSVFEASGSYGYRRDFLLKFVAWEPGILENNEKLEQLRVLERVVPFT